MNRIRVAAAAALLVAPLLVSAQTTAPAESTKVSTDGTAHKAKKPSKLKKALSKPDRTNKPGENGTKQPQ